MSLFPLPALWLPSLMAGSSRPTSWRWWTNCNARAAWLPWPAMASTTRQRWFSATSAFPVHMRCDR